MENTQQPKQPEPKPEPKKHEFPVGTLVLYAVFICAGILISKFAFDALTPRFMPSAKAPSAPSAPAAAARVAAAPRPAAAVPAPSPLEVVKKTVKKAVEPYELNGIYFSKAEACALVNNKIVQTGDQVDGATVTRISEEEVELTRDNKVIRLISRNK